MLIFAMPGQAGCYCRRSEVAAAVGGEQHKTAGRATQNGHRTWYAAAQRYASLTSARRSGEE